VLSACHEYQAAADILPGRPKYPHDAAVAGEVKEILSLEDGAQDTEIVPSSHPSITSSAVRFFTSYEDARR